VCAEFHWIEWKVKRWKQVFLKEKEKDAWCSGGCSGEYGYQSC
jgi:hypothetical protein